MGRDLVLALTISESDKAYIRKRLEEEADEEELRSCLSTMAMDFEGSHPKRAAYIEKHMEELISMYKREVSYWRYEALNYAAINKQGVRDHLESALEADNEWESVDNGLNV